MQISTTFRGMMPSEPLLAAVRRHCEKIVGVRSCETVLIDEGATCTVTIHVDTNDGSAGSIACDPDAHLAVANAFAALLDKLREKNPQAYSEAAQ